MQAVCSTSSAFKGATVARKATTSRVTSVRAAPRVVCSAQQNFADKAKAAAVALPAVFVSQPAFALVDQRLGGEGTGKILGISGGEGWAILLVFGLVWSLFYASQKVLGGGDGEDSGLSL